MNTSLGLSLVPLQSKPPAKPAVKAVAKPARAAKTASAAARKVEAFKPKLSVVYHGQSDSDSDIRITLGQVVPSDEFFVQAEILSGKNAGDRWRIYRGTSQKDAEAHFFKYVL